MIWKTLQPNDHGDWLKQRNEIFDTYIPIFDKEEKPYFNLITLLSEVIEMYGFIIFQKET